MRFRLALVYFFFSFPLLPPAAAEAQRGADRYALVLEDPPLARQASSRKDPRLAAASDPARRIEAAQQSLIRQLRERKIDVVGSNSLLVNAVFVRAPEERLPELRGLPGVTRVASLPPMRRHLDRAVDLVRARDAWTALGGVSASGSGVKIGILDTGIDQNHPAFQDSSLQTPAGYPKCYAPAGDCAYATNKIIAVRSYVDQLAAGYGNDPAATSRPDDTTPRDRVGHGTAAAMIAAGGPNTDPVTGLTITGIAPKAWLGNYKIFGSPGVNDVVLGDVLINALSDAVADGMDVVSLSLGSPSLWGALDTCQYSDGSPGPCDVRAYAIESAARLGVAVVVSAGNDGDVGLYIPSLNTIHTPGTAPSAITVGATTNSHIFFAGLTVTGSDVPPSLQPRIPALFGDGARLGGPLTAPLRDVRKTGDDGLACTALASGSLNGAFALVQRGTCSFVTKADNVQKAGAIGMVLFLQEGADYIFPPTGMANSGIPSVMIGNTDGKALRTFLDTHPDRQVTMDPALRGMNAEYDTVADFSSHGPSTGDSAIKPELVAVGTDLLVATQKFDPNGELYDASGYTAVQGTSFSAPMVAGAVALAKQKNPNLLGAGLKSAVVNTASPNEITEYTDEATVKPARVTAVGAGKLNAAEALKANVAAVPATLSFGIVAAGAWPSPRQIQVTNTGTTAVQLTFQVVARDQDANARVTLDKSSLALAAGQTGTLVATLTGSAVPQPGAYEGAIVIGGAATAMRIPYLYLVGTGVPYNAFPLRGDGFAGIVNSQVPSGYLTLKVVDRYGVPVANQLVQFRPTLGGGTIVSTTNNSKTDSYGIVEADVDLGPRLGEQEFAADVGSPNPTITVYFTGRARLLPAINEKGVVNGGSYQVGSGVAPGSFISIFGQNLSDASRKTPTLSLPLSLAGVSVSFDVPEKSISLPGRLHYVSDQQINVQVPWGLTGLTTVKMKVSIGDYSSAVYSVPLNDYSPAFFEVNDPGTGRLYAAALDADNRLITDANPARRDGTDRERTVVFFVNGLGPIQGGSSPPDGEPTPVGNLYWAKEKPQVTVGGQAAEVDFWGLSPGSVALYQINARIPRTAGTGQQPVAITVGGVTSKTANIPVR